jgi:hypothetical protein
LALAAALLAGCSLLIDVEPDCSEVADCSPYVCNASNTACLSSCLNDLECADGFVCELGRRRCISQGCVGTDAPRSVLTLGTGSFEYDAARFDDRFFVLFANNERVGLLEVTAGGEVADGEGAVLTLDNHPTPPVVPVAAANDQGVALLWRGTLDTNLFDLRAFHLGADGQTRGPAVVYEGRRGQSLDTPEAAYFRGALLVVWSTFVNRARVELLELNQDTSFGPDERQPAPNDATILVTGETAGSSLPGVAATVERPAIVRRETAAGATTVKVSFLDSTLRPINDQDVSGSPSPGIQRVLAAGMTSAIAVAWIATVEGVPTLFRAVANDNGPVLMGTPSQEAMTDLQDATLAAGTTEFALLWVADAFDGREGRDVFMRRFDATGQPLFVTFSASGRQARNPSRPRLVRTSDGYAAFWVEEGGATREVMFRRFVCAR